MSVTITWRQWRWRDVCEDDACQWRQCDVSDDDMSQWRLCYVSDDYATPVTTTLRQWRLRYASDDNATSAMTTRHRDGDATSVTKTKKFYNIDTWRRSAVRRGRSVCIFLQDRLDSGSVRGFGTDRFGIWTSKKDIFIGTALAVFVITCLLL